MPPHEVYIETHLGGGNVLERKKPAARNIGIDLDPNVIAAWSDARSRLAFPIDLHCVDATTFLRAYPFTGRELVYCDPPYLMDTRRSQADLYAHEYTEADHVELLDLLVTLPCPVLLSGYPSSLYTTVLQHRHKWRCVEFQAMTRGGLATEALWFNFVPGALHDTRYVGADFRERERIQRKKKRWRSRLAAMEASERQAIMDVLRELSIAETIVSQSRSLVAGNNIVRNDDDDDRLFSGGGR